jgi:hypothetical protein
MLTHASKAFSILTFARRPLHLTELMDAIGIIDKYPFKAPLTRLLAPMIDVQQDPQDQDDLICHIFHSTLRTFLLNHPTVFRQNLTSIITIDLSITSYAIANACLSYLSQPKYSTSLTKIDGRWLTSTGQDIMKSHFLTYSVKFWDKHMQHGDDFPDISSSVEQFLRSTNFVTTLQVQSLCMYRAFGTLPPTIRKVLKDIWQVSQAKTWGVHSSQGFWTRYGGPFRDDYNDFLFEWKYFLHRPTCYDERCRKSPFQGEVDRILWNTLGHENFLKRNVSRYTSFILDTPPETQPEPIIRYWEAFSDDGAEAHVLRLLPLP